MLLTTDISHCYAAKKKDKMSHFISFIATQFKTEFLSMLIISPALHNGWQGMKLPL